MDDFSDDPLDPWAREFWEWIKLQSMPLDRWITAVSSLALLGVTFSQLVLSCNNARETAPLVGYAKDNTKASQDFAKSADTIDKSLQTAVQKLNTQAEKATILAKNSGIQASASATGARAAASAAVTARDTLRVSEGAYITTGTPVEAFTEGLVRVSLPNSGHIPSGQAKVLIFEATTEKPTAVTPDGTMLRIVETHWQSGVFAAIPPGNPFSYMVQIPSARSEAVTSGDEVVYIVGEVTYNDGFADDSDRVWPFCWQSLAVFKVRQVNWGVCDSSHYILQFRDKSGYPDPKRRL